MNLYSWFLRIVEWTKRKVASEEGKKKNLILFCLQLLQTYSRILTTINIGKDFAWSHTMFELYIFDRPRIYSKYKLKIVEDMLCFLAKLLRIRTNVLIESIIWICICKSRLVFSVSKLQEQYKTCWFNLYCEYSNQD